MRFTHIKLENWRNFSKVDVPLLRRVFLVGPNASGKSNLLDAFRFLRDIADPQGGFQRAVVHVRNGVSCIRSLHARRFSNVVVEVQAGADDGLSWRYRLEFSHDPEDKRHPPLVRREIVHRGDKVVIDRPDHADRADGSRLTQTYLQQVNANKEFRGLQELFASVRYLHIVPQLVRDPARSVGRAADPFGGDFIEQIGKVSAKTRSARLRKVTAALRVAIPQLQELEWDRDRRSGEAHLRGLYAHWRPRAGWQTEDQFSDGSLRLFGLLWSLLDGSAPLLLEEPELSLHPEVIRYIPGMMARLCRRTARQVFVSTHSADLLSDPGIAPEEVLLLRPAQEGTEVTVASGHDQVRILLEGGNTIGEAVLPMTAPRRTEQLALFGE